MTTQLPVVCNRGSTCGRPTSPMPSPSAALLADPSRAAILRMLADGPRCVCEMAAALGARENNVSNHLAKLRDAGLVRATRHDANARFLYYERDEEAIAAARAALADVLR